MGTLDWARRTSGRLGRADRLRLFAQAALARLEGVLRRRGLPSPAVDLEAIRVPDSTLCRDAESHAAAVCGDWLLNHCLRTYAWGCLLGAAERRTFDAEILFVAAVLHDLGLAGAAAAAEAPPVDCFAVEGAFAAEAFLAARGVAGDRNRRVAEAISLHMNVRVGAGAGVEAHLLHEGAAMDVIGARLEEIPGGARDAVLSRHPRLEMKHDIAAAMDGQSARRPRSRAAFLRRLGFVTMIRRAPYAS